MSKLAQLTQDPKVSIDEIGAFLDSLSESERLTETADLSRDEQRALYQKAEAAAPMTLSDLHRDLGSGTGVTHEGLNTLPVPKPFRRFQKVFAVAPDDPTACYGYNDGLMRPIVGPGYFVAETTEKRKQWQDRGSIVVDYYQVPPGGVPRSWPSIKRNEQGLQRFVFKGTRDFLRKVSNHVSIGAAYKDGKSLDHYFVLCAQR